MQIGDELRQIVLHIARLLESYCEQHIPLLILVLLQDIGLIFVVALFFAVQGIFLYGKSGAIIRQLQKEIKQKDNIIYNNNIRADKKIGIYRAIAVRERAKNTLLQGKE